jgi:DNA (cytosine-5)-methyltransferase 1
MTAKSHTKARRKLNITAIFGGVGGLELGLHKGGHRTSLFCEYDPQARAVLKRRFPGIPSVPDIRKTDEVIAAISRSSDLLTAGFPCTDLSQAGRTLGFAGGRSSLIRETLDLLTRRRFPHVLIENVPNWRHLHRGHYMGEVLAALERLGYKWAYRTIDSLAFGLPQRRNRIFLFASLSLDPRAVLFHGDQLPDESSFSLDEAAHGFYWTEGNRGLGWGENCVPTLKGGSSVGIPSPPAILMPDLSIITPSIGDAERLQGFPKGWTDLEVLSEPKPPQGFKARRRWMHVGNAVNVSVSAWLGERLANASTYDGEVGERLERGIPWPMAAWSDGRNRYSVAIGSWPVKRARKGLAEFLNDEGAILSERASRGFYSRICASSLRFKHGFKEAVAAHIKVVSKVSARKTKPSVRRTSERPLLKAA